MNTLFVQRIRSDWDSVTADSCLHRITALAGTEELGCTGQVTLFTGENGSGCSMTDMHKPTYRRTAAGRVCGGFSSAKLINVSRTY